MALQTTLLTLLVLVPQEESSPTPQDSNQSNAAHVEQLRGRIHDMRMSLVLGGDDVRAAENEAIGFYGEKVELIDQRLDSISTDLSEKRATYDVTLERALSSNNPQARAASMEKAQGLRSEISSLESEGNALRKKRGDLTSLVDAVETRGRERQSLAARLETTNDFDSIYGLSVGGVGLAPTVAVQPTGSAIDDDALVKDLLERDVVGAHRILFEADPIRFWERFPMRPPTTLLRQSIPFPMADLPGNR